MTTAETILNIPAGQPEKLFSRDRFESEFKTLMRTWHPDSNKDPLAAKVATHLNELRDQAKKKIAAGIWSEVGKLILTGKDHKTRTIYWKAKHSFELGDVYYGDKVVAYVVNSGFQSLFDSAMTTISTLHYADSQMASVITPYMPHIKSTFETADGQKVLVLEKPSGVYTIRDVMNSLPGGVLPAEAAAWVISCCFNLACYLEWSRLCHGDFSLDSIFIEPKTHSAYMLGGWWYATGVGQNLKFLPQRSFNLAPRDTVNAKMADQRTDLLLIRALGREMIGYDGHTAATQVPAPMINFLRHPTTGVALEDYRIWREDVLPAAFGARRFVELNVNESDIFKEA